MSKVFVLGGDPKKEKTFSVELVPTNYLNGDHEVLVKVNGETVVAFICPTDGISRGQEKEDRVSVFKNAAKRLGLEVEISNI